MKRITSLLLLIIALFCAKAESYTVDNAGNTVFSRTIEGLGLTAAEIHAAAVEHMENAYKDARYNITDNNATNGSVAGEARLNGIHHQNGIIASQVFSATVKLRVDAKDGRARIRLIARNYDVKQMSDVAKGSEEELLISQCEPVGSVNSGKGFSKAFETLSGIAEKLLNSAEKDIRNTQPAETEDW